MKKLIAILLFLPYLAIAQSGASKINVQPLNIWTANTRYNISQILQVGTNLEAVAVPGISGTTTPNWTSSITTDGTVQWAFVGILPKPVGSMNTQDWMNTLTYIPASFGAIPDASGDPAADGTITSITSGSVVLGTISSSTNGMPNGTYTNVNYGSGSTPTGVITLGTPLDMTEFTVGQSGALTINGATGSTLGAGFNYAGHQGFFATVVNSTHLNIYYSGVTTHTAAMGAPFAPNDTCTTCGTYDFNPFTISGTDNTAAFNSLFTLIATIGGGRIRIGPGQYFGFAHSIVQPEHITIEGASMGTSGLVALKNGTWTNYWDMVSRTNRTFFWAMISYSSSTGSPNFYGQCTDWQGNYPSFSQQHVALHDLNINAGSVVGTTIHSCGGEEGSYIEHGLIQGQLSMGVDLNSYFGIQNFENVSKNTIYQSFGIVTNGEIGVRIVTGVRNKVDNNTIALGNGLGAIGIWFVGCQACTTTNNHFENMKYNVAVTNGDATIIAPQATWTDLGGAEIAAGYSQVGTYFGASNGYSATVHAFNVSGGCGLTGGVCPQVQDFTLRNGYTYYSFFPLADYVAECNQNGGSTAPCQGKPESSGFLGPPAVWVAGTSYAIGAQVIDSSGYIQQCSVAGTSAGSGPPSFSHTYGSSVTDNTVTWVNQTLTASLQNQLIRPVNADWFPNPLILGNNGNLSIQGGNIFSGYNSGVTATDGSHYFFGISGFSSTHTGYIRVGDQTVLVQQAGDGCNSGIGADTCGGLGLTTMGFAHAPGSGAITVGLVTNMGTNTVRCNGGSGSCVASGVFMAAGGGTIVGWTGQSEGSTPSFTGATAASWAGNVWSFNGLSGTAGPLWKNASTNVVDATGANFASFLGSLGTNQLPEWTGSAWTAYTPSTATGTVTSLTGSTPIVATPSTITTTGAFSCPSCVVASSPGVGLAHFAGGTQTVTSSLVALGSDVSGLLPTASGGTNNNSFSGNAPVGTNGAGNQFLTLSTTGTGTVVVMSASPTITGTLTYTTGTGSSNAAAVGTDTVGTVGLSGCGTAGSIRGDTVVTFTLGTGGVGCVITMTPSVSPSGIHAWTCFAADATKFLWVPPDETSLSSTTCKVVVPAAAVTGDIMMAWLFWN